MRSRLLRVARAWLLIFRVAVLVALGASSMLYVHYLNPIDSDFCGLDSTCENVRRAPFSYFGSKYLSLPLLGVLAYLGLFSLSLVEAARARSSGSSKRTGAEALSWTVSAALVGAGLGIALLGYQLFAVGGLCWLCAIVDTAALVAGVSAYRWRAALAGSAERSADPLKPQAWLGLALVVVLGTVSWYFVRPAPPVPGPIRALYQPGKINVVEFADFQCPFCRRLHPVLARVIESYGDDVHVIRRHYPLAQHPLARPAARVAVCAEAQGKGDEVTDALFEKPLSAERLDTLPDELGLDAGKLKQCLDDPGTDQRIDADMALLDASDFKGLPTTYVGAERIVGAVHEAAFRDAFERAREDASGGGLPGAVYFTLLCGLAGALVWVGRDRP